MKKIMMLQQSPLQETLLKLKNLFEVKINHKDKKNIGYTEDWLRVSPCSPYLCVKKSK